MNLIGPKAYINTGRLKQNLWNIRRHVGDRTIMCVVKANGYGHGAIQIAKAISREPGIIFGVFAVEEAVDLRENGLENDIFSSKHYSLSLSTETQFKYCPDNYLSFVSKRAKHFGDNGHAQWSENNPFDRLSVREKALLFWNPFLLDMSD